MRGDDVGGPVWELGFEGAAHVLIEGLDFFGFA